jgi:hypothetical protein
MLFNNSVLSINFIVTIIIDLVDAARYIRDLYSLLKLFRNRKKD